MRILNAVGCLACALAVFGGYIGNLPFDPLKTVVFVLGIWCLGKTSLVPN